MSQRQEELSDRLWESHHKHVHEEHMVALRKTDSDIQIAEEGIAVLDAIGIDTSSIRVQIERLNEKKEAQQQSAWDYLDRFKK